MKLVLVVAVKSTKNVMAKTPRKIVKLIGVLLVLVTSSNIYAQTEGKVRINADPRLERELKEDIEHNDSIALKGYRIQIYFGNDKNEAEKIIRKFKNLYPESKNESYLRYYQPYWRVRIGNYYRKVDAQHLLYKLISDFDNVLLIKDEIELPEIILEKEEPVED
jgi:hypothetical protein